MVAPVAEVVDSEVTLMGITDFSILRQQRITPTQHNAVYTRASIDDGLQGVASWNGGDGAHRSIRQHRCVLLVGLRMCHEIAERADDYRLRKILGEDDQGAGSIHALRDIRVRIPHT